MACSTFARFHTFVYLRFDTLFDTFDTLFDTFVYLRFDTPNLFLDLILS